MTASTGWCWAPVSTGARSPCCAPIANICARPAIAFSQDYMEETLAGNARHRRAAGASCSARMFDPAGKATADAARAADRRRRSRRRWSGSPTSTKTASCGASSTSSNRRCAPISSRRRRQGGRSPTSPSSSIPTRVDELPLPRPLVEIFVYSPRVEAIHLRGGKVARGGIRWSDRREDFRTEVLGLMKAQMVKNAVIVPAGSKGGFVVKRPPATGGREALDGRGGRVLQDADARPAGHHRQSGRRRGDAAGGCGAPRRRRSLSGGRRRQGHGHLLRHRQLRVSDRIRLLAGRRLRLRRLGRL